MKRRNFIKIAAVAAAAAGLVGLMVTAPRVSCRADGKPPRIAVGRNEKITLEDDPGNLQLVRALLDESLRAVLDAKTAEDAWRRLFSRRDKVAIKTSCLPGPKLSTTVVLVRAVVEGLKLAGVREDNIIIWERTTRELERAGFKANRGGGVKCYGTDSVYELEPELHRSIGSRFSTILTRRCSAVVNVPVLKDHDIAGVSLGMKSFFGAIDNPNKYHGNNCDPYIADLSTHPYIKKKLRLVVCDGLLAQYDGGPAYKPGRAWDYRGIIVGTDPVAVDWMGAKIIEERRKEKGLKPLKAAGREPKHIATAARIGVGTSDPESATLIDV